MCWEIASKLIYFDVLVFYNFFIYFITDHSKEQLDCILEEVLVEILVDVVEEEEVYISIGFEQVNHLEGERAFLLFEDWLKEESIIPFGFPVANSSWGFPAIDGDDLSGDNIKIEGLCVGVDLEIGRSIDSNKHVLHKLKKFDPVLVVDKINFSSFIW